MLKFKEFSEILESMIFEDRDSWKTSSKKQPYWDAYKNKVSDKNPINTKSNELIRGSFGLDSTLNNDVSDIVKNNINSMFAEVGETVIKIEKFLPGENRVQGSHGSGDMVTYLVITDKNGEGYYITNNSTSTKVKVEGVEKLFRPKDLTPTKLGLDTNEYTTKESLVQASSNAIRDFVKDELHQKFILKLIDACSDPQRYGFSDKPRNSIDDVLGQYTINCEFEEFEKIEELGNLGNIQNDFGEVLGSIFVFNLVKPEAIGGGVKYPSGNEKLIDFIFNGKGISSKAGKGSAATITEYIRKIDDAVNTGWQLSPEQIEAKDRILAPLSLGENSIERKPNQWFIGSKGSGVFSGAIALFNALNLTGWMTFKKEFGISDSNDINRDDIIDGFDRMAKRGSLFKSLKMYKNSVKFDPQSSNRYFTSIINSENPKESKESWIEFIKSRRVNPSEYKEALDLLIGSVLYPCSNEVTDYIYKEKQKNGETYMRIINDMINHSVNVNQLNLTINIKKDSINFGMYASEKSTYKIQGLNSFGQPLMANFKIKKQ
jgi:hypothetical protein